MSGIMVVILLSQKLDFQEKLLPSVTLNDFLGHTSYKKLRLHNII